MFLILYLFAVALSATVELQFLGLSDWHGQVDPLYFEGSSHGGCAALHAYFKQARQAHPNTITTMAGDAWFGMPSLSSYNPHIALRCQELLEVDVDTFGNHNFDKGVSACKEMLQNSSITHVSANLNDTDSELGSLFSAYRIMEFEGVKVALIGITNEDAPSKVVPGNFGNIQVMDAVTSATEAKIAAAAEGAQVFVVVAHLGFLSVTDGKATGPLADFANASAGAFHLIIGDHENVQHVEIIDGTTTLENYGRGVYFHSVLASFDTETNEFTVNSVNQTAAKKDDSMAGYQEAVTMMTPFKTAFEAFGLQKFAQGTGDFPEDRVQREKETALGNLCADSARVAGANPAQIGFANGGAIRSAIPSGLDTSSDSSLNRNASDPPFDIVQGDMTSVHPFENRLGVISVTGAIIKTVLEHSVSWLPEREGGFLQVSGLKFTANPNATVGSRVVCVFLEDGTELKDATSYTVSTNEFLLQGGDGFSSFVGPEYVTTEIDAVALQNYVSSNSPITPSIEGRIVYADVCAWTTSESDSDSNSPTTSDAGQAVLAGSALLLALL